MEIIDILNLVLLFEINDEEQIKANAGGGGLKYYNYFDHEIALYLQDFLQ